MGREPNPQPTPEQRAVDLGILRRGLAYCASLGITSFHNMDGNFYQLELLEKSIALKGSGCAGVCRSACCRAWRCRSSARRSKCAAAGIPSGSRPIS